MNGMGKGQIWLNGEGIRRHWPAYKANDKNAGDDDNCMFTVRSSPRPISWLGGHTENVIAAMAGDWYRYHIRKPEPYSLLAASCVFLIQEAMLQHEDNFDFLISLKSQIGSSGPQIDFISELRQAIDEETLKGIIIAVIENKLW
ncbi:hypothetical protein Tco_0375222 [Tanacetum coccineum]